MNTQKITLDICKNDYKTVTVKQYDKDSRNLIVQCTANNTEFKIDYSIHQCKVKMLTPKGRPLYKTATVQTDGTILIKFDEDMMYESGTGKLEIEIIETVSRRKISTMILTVIIVGSVYPEDVIIASEEFSGLTDAIADFAEVLDGIVYVELVGEETEPYKAGITGITDKLNVESSTIALSTVAGKELQNQISEVNAATKGIENKIKIIEENINEIPNGVTYVDFANSVVMAEIW